MDTSLQPLQLARPCSARAQLALYGAQYCGEHPGNSAPPRAFRSRGPPVKMKARDP